MLGLIGKKIGMTQVFDDQGNLEPVTIVKVETNIVVGKRTDEKDGYEAVIIGAVPKKVKNVTKAFGGQFPKGIDPLKYLREFRNFSKECEIGENLSVELFEKIKYVDVQGITKGKGFQGVMKRHGFHGGNKTHGSKFHRAAGSTGMAAWPSRVHKGTKMAGRMGGVVKKIQNLKIINIDKENGLLIIKGAVMGTKDSSIIITESLKKK